MSDQGATKLPGETAEGFDGAESRTSCRKQQRGVLDNAEFQRS